MMGARALGVKVSEKLTEPLPAAALRRERVRIVGERSDLPGLAEGFDPIEGTTR